MENNFLFDFDISEDDEEFTDSKKDLLKFLKEIGVDTRFISIYDNKIYINNLRFSKFSKRRQSIFESKFKDKLVIRSSLFQEIATNASRELSNTIKPKMKILIKEDANPLINIILEPYTRKYGVELIYSNKKEYDVIASNQTMDMEIHSICEDIFKGKGIKYPRFNKEYIYPLIKVTHKQINDFLGEKLLEEKYDDVSGEFIEFLDDTVSQYKFNILKSVQYLQENSIR
ncbi:ATPase [uncultured Methanobrevibacter sp.]|uniref:ATPase n=1 Tax=uncultured Methanobrevibacter sp. TaxID=253161 RepID=UPI0025F759BD|nr:ATPase [uncultured Methanobrevibacter sp.]